MKTEMQKEREHLTGLYHGMETLLTARGTGIQTADLICGI